MMHKNGVGKDYNIFRPLYNIRARRLGNLVPLANTAALRAALSILNNPFQLSALLTSSCGPSSLTPWPVTLNPKLKTLNRGFGLQARYCWVRDAGGKTQSPFRD